MNSTPPWSRMRWHQPGQPDLGADVAVAERAAGMGAVAMHAQFRQGGEGSAHNHRTSRRFVKPGLLGGLQRLRGRPRPSPRQRRANLHSDAATRECACQKSGQETEETGWDGHDDDGGRGRRRHARLATVSTRFMRCRACRTTCCSKRCSSSPTGCARYTPGTNRARPIWRSAPRSRPASRRPIAVVPGPGLLNARRGAADRLLP